MAIIYSYPSNTNILPTDVILGTTTSTTNQKNQTKSFKIETLADYFTPSLDQVLDRGNTSLLDAKIGKLYLYDEPNGEYSSISFSDSIFTVGNSVRTILASDGGGNLVLYNDVGGIVLLNNNLTTFRAYSFPNESGIFALTSSLNLQSITSGGNTTNLPITVASLITTGQALIGTTVTGTPTFGSDPHLVVTKPYTGTSIGGVIDLRNLSPSIVVNNLLGKIQFTGKDDVTVGYTSGVIECIAAGTAGSGVNSGGILKFMTARNETGASTIERMRITETGIVQPGTDNSYSLGASGIRWSAVWAANGTIQTSDEREKKDIVDSDLGLDFISKLRPVSFKWKVGKNEVTSEPDGLDEEGNQKTKIVVTPIEGKRTHYGLIAQEVETLLDGKDFGGFIHDTGTDIKGLRYDQFIPVLINAIKELKAEIEILKVK